MNAKSNRGRRLPNSAGHRRDALWLAALVHRLSGLALAGFLPLHFLALALALKSEAALDGFLRWTTNPAVKVAEMGLVFLLTVHLAGGIRLLVLENTPWFGQQQRLAAGALILAGIAAVAFLVRAA